MLIFAEIMGSWMFLDHVSPVKFMVMGCWITMVDVSYVVWFMTNDIDLCRYLGYFVSFLFLGIGPLLDSLLDKNSEEVLLRRSKAF